MFEGQNFCGFCLNRKFFPWISKCFGTCVHCFDVNAKVFPRILTWWPNLVLYGIILYYTSSWLISNTGHTRILHTQNYTDYNIIYMFFIILNMHSTPDMLNLPHPMWWHADMVTGSQTKAFLSWYEKYMWPTLSYLTHWLSSLYVTFQVANWLNSLKVGTLQEKWKYICANHFWVAVCKI